MADSEKIALVGLTSQIVVAYLAKNKVASGELQGLIASLYAKIAILVRPEAQAKDSIKPIPPVSINKSVTDEYLISLEDGKRYQTLKRHLTTRGLTPEAYRIKWNLPNSYPMDAPAYKARRSEIAKKRGLGRTRVNDLYREIM